MKRWGSWASGMDRSLANLPQNPHAVFLIREPGTSLVEWKGIRVYLKMKAAATSGRRLDGYRTGIGKVIGADTSKKDDPCHGNL